MRFTDETRKRVLEAASELGYVPNAAAQVHVSTLEHGLEAVKSLNGLLQGERPSTLVKTLETPLVIRESCGAVTLED